MVTSYIDRVNYFFFFKHSLFRTQLNLGKHRCTSCLKQLSLKYPSLYVLKNNSSNMPWFGLCFILLKSEFRPNLQLSFHKRYTHLYKRTTEKNKPISLAFCSRLKNHISRKRTVKTQRKASIAEGQTMYFLDPHFLSLLGSPVLKSIKVRARKSR